MTKNNPQMADAFITAVGTEQLDKEVIEELEDQDQDLEVIIANEKTRQLHGRTDS